MLKTYKYRIYPTNKQISVLGSILEECRYLYNRLLEQRRYAWEIQDVSLSYYQQKKMLPFIKKYRYPLSCIYSQVLDNATTRLDLAFKSFFRRVKMGQKPGFPRFKNKDRYNSFTYPQFGFKIINDKFVNLSKIGDIKFKYHRQIEGNPKTCTIKRTPTGKWFVTFSCEIQPKYLPKTNKSVGIDVGIKSFAHLSDNVIIPNPKFFKESEQKLAKAQRKLSSAKKGSKQRYKYKKIVSKIHEHITNKRSNFSHQQSRQIINNYDIICVEDLNINQMQQNSYHCMNKNISDVAWSQFFDFLSYKAVEAGRKLVKVNPAYTSQDCSSCGQRQLMPLSQREYSCPCCGLKTDRDLNASLNILRLGMQSLGENFKKPSHFVRKCL